MTQRELHDFLESKYRQYNHLSFIGTDPISVPHHFKRKEDIEIAAFLTSAIAWGQRTTIIKNANRLIELMDNSPYDFLMNYSPRTIHATAIDLFVHRTFNGTDCRYFFQSLKNIYTKHKGIESAFAIKNSNVKDAIARFRKIFFSLEHPSRTGKHIANPSMGASAKRINMFLRWMVRKDVNGVDFGLWKNLSPSLLMCPLDIHSGNVARKLGLLKRKQNDWQAVEELTNSLRMFDASDPVKYDFALFGLGVFEGF